MLQKPRIDFDENIVTLPRCFNNSFKQFYFKCLLTIEIATWLNKIIPFSDSLCLFFKIVMKLT